MSASLYPPIAYGSTNGDARRFAACAGSIPSVDLVHIPRFRQEIVRDPDDTDLQVQLGMAQFKAEDYETARASLQRAFDAGNRHLVVGTSAPAPGG